MTHKHWRRAAGIGAIAALCSVSPLSAQTAPALGGAQSFAVLGGSTVTNTGTSTVSGNVGASPGSAITGFPPGVVSPGTTHAGDAAAALAQVGLTAAYNNAASQPFTVDLTGQDLGGLILTAGVYRFASSAQLTGVLTLDAQGDPNAVFIFQIGSSLTTASNAIVSVVNGGQSCNVFWQVGSSATLGTSTLFAGNILALTSITLNTSASVDGRALARNGAVTLDTNSIGGACVAAACPVIGFAPAVLPNAVLGSAYNQSLAGTGGVGPYTFSVVSGTLPAGMTLTAAGVLSGTPTIAGPSTFTIRATAADACFTDITRTLTVLAAACPVIGFTPDVLPDAVLGSAYSQSLAGTGGVGPYTFSVTSGTLPAGMTLSAAGVLAGTPTVAGPSTFTIRATAADACFTDISRTLTVVTAVPTLPQTLLILLALTLVGIGYLRLRRRSPA